MVGANVSASADANLIFAKASASISVNITNSWTASQEVSGSWHIPNNGRRGWIAVGNDKYRVTGTVKYQRPNCSVYTKQVSFDGISTDISYKHGQD